ncbi:MAG: M23 family metallopeptidase [Saprospiraceae bacterium]|nr:M23 family metallopeptidase [Saprospiraceae bacterium]
MMNRSRFFTLAFLWFLSIHKDQAHPFVGPPAPFLLSSPLPHKIAVTGSFGELRNNHFHAGIDLRSSRGTEGDQILSASGGFIRKIKIDSKNYGNSIIVEHPGGFSTLYAHISKFRSDIEDRIKSEQYSSQENELEIEFGDNEWHVNSGEHIAYMGNTGDSRGAHLHFELRLTGTDQVLDPMTFGLPVEDEIAPQFRKFKLYGFDLEGNEVSEKLTNGNKLSKINIPGDVFGMAVEAYDKSNNSWRSLGIKYIKMFVDNSLFYAFSMDQWSLQDTRYINAHVDYESRSQGRFHRCFKLQGNKIPIYHSVENDGFFYIGDGGEHLVEIIIGDAKGNETRKSFIIQNTPYSTPFRKSEYEHVLSFDRSFNYDFGFGNFSIDEGSIYDQIQCKIDTLRNTFSNSYSPWVGITPNNQPLHKGIKVSVKPTTEIPDGLHSKCFVGLKRGNGYVSLNGDWKNGQMVSSSKYLGYYSILTDTTPPRLFPKNYKFNMSGKKAISFTMGDNVSDITESRSGIKYNAYIDGQWVIMEHDLKSRTISHTFEPWLSNGTHEILVVLEDVRNNKKEYRYNFYK